MKQMKKALLSTAVLLGLSAGNAYAGSEACFEIQKGAADVATWATIYQKAECSRLAGTPDAQLAALNPVQVAFELTRNQNLSLGSVGATKQFTYYVPTTNIPGASRITVKVANTLGDATFAGNANQLHLLRLTEDTVTGDFTLASVASTDGAVDGQAEIMFVVDAANNLPAGARLLVSKTKPITTLSGPIADIVTFLDNDYEGFGINIKNPDVCPVNPSVTITATKVVTDANFEIEGGKSKAETLVDTSPQFSSFTNLAGQAILNTPAVAKVDALEPSRLSKFLTGFGDLVNVAGQDEVHFVKYFNNREDELDLAVSIAAGDRFDLAPSYTGNATGLAHFGVRDRFAADGVTNDYDSIAPVAGTAFYALTDAPVTKRYFLSDFFEDGLEQQARVFAIRNSDETKAMGYNYVVNANWGIDFANTTYIDRDLSCGTVKTHDVTVNGTSLKVPYVFNTSNQWVRISNESDSTATVFFDIYGENNVNSEQTRGVLAGTIPANSAKVFLANELIARAKAEGYTHTSTNGVAAGSGGHQAKDRHTITFLVTAPESKVHGVSVQAIPGGVDRVIPVLRDVVVENQGIWQQ